MTLILRGYITGMPEIEIKLNDIPLEIPIRLKHGGTAIVVIRTDNGVSAFHDRCPHAQWPISDGEIIDGMLVCPGHGWQFNVFGGQCLNSPAYRLKPLSVKVHQNTIHIEWD
jgi:nitrite reductase/ring-hydroxylating ferredoxin subunit